MLTAEQVRNLNRLEGIQKKIIEQEYEGYRYLSLRYRLKDDEIKTLESLGYEVSKRTFEEPRSGSYDYYIISWKEDTEDE